MLGEMGLSGILVRPAKAGIFSERLTHQGKSIMVPENRTTEIEMEASLRLCYSIKVCYTIAQ